MPVLYGPFCVQDEPKGACGHNCQNYLHTMPKLRISLNDGIESLVVRHLGNVRNLVG